jgi:hypothetical protein
MHRSKNTANEDVVMGTLAYHELWDDGLEQEDPTKEDVMAAVE